MIVSCFVAMGCASLSLSENKISLSLYCRLGKLYFGEIIDITLSVVDKLKHFVSSCKCLFRFNCPSRTSYFVQCSTEIWQRLKRTNDHLDNEKSIV